MASKRKPRRRDLRRGRDLRIGVPGSPVDVEHLRALSRTAVLGFPAGAQALDDAVRRFLTDTAEVRTPRRSESADLFERPARGGVVVVFGYALLVVVLMASIAAATALLPTGRHDPGPSLMFALSTSAAYLVVFAAIVGCPLPPWGRADTRALAWQLHLVAALCLLVGLLIAVAPIGQRDLAEVGSRAWSGWFVANVVARVAVVVGTVVRKGHADRWVPLVGYAPPKARRATHQQYLIAVRHPLSQAARAMDRVVVAHPGEVAAVDEAWRAGVDAAQRAKKVSRPAAARARSISAYRWSLEHAATVPEAFDDEP